MKLLQRFKLFCLKNINSGIYYLLIMIIIILLLFLLLFLDKYYYVTRPDDVSFVYTEIGTGRNLGLRFSNSTVLNLKKLCRLDVEEVAGVVSKYDFLQGLSFDGCAGFGDEHVWFLHNFSNLIDLDLAGTRVRNISFVKGFNDSLFEISLRSTGIVDVNPLSDCKGITLLSLRDNPDLVDVGFLLDGSFTRLLYLDLRGTGVSEVVFLRLRGVYPSSMILFYPGDGNGRLREFLVSSLWHNQTIQ